MEVGGIDRRAEGHKGMEVCQDQWRRQLREKQIFAYTNNNVLSFYHLASPDQSSTDYTP